MAEYSANGAAGAPQKEYGYRDGQLLVTAEAPVALTNVALAANGSTVSASSTMVNPPYTYPVSAVNNGDHKGLNAGLGGTWLSSTAAFPQWVQVDFNGSKTISQIGVFSLQDNYANPIEPTETTTFSLYGLTGFDVQYWTGSTWATIPGGSVSGNNKVWKKISFAPLATSKIRISINGSVDGWSRVVEVEAWTGTPANINWLVADHLGTPRIILDQTGSFANLRRHDYLPFGEELSAGTGGRTASMGYGAGDGVRQQFTSKERDTETGLDYFGARCYAGPQGRFTTTDEFWKDSQVSNPQSWNKYAYVRNNPTRYIDPEGEKADIKIKTDEEKKKGTITIKATIGIWTRDNTNISTDDLKKAAAEIKSVIEKAWSGQYEQNGITYAVTTVISAQAYSSEEAAISAGSQNVIQMVKGDLGNGAYAATTRGLLSSYDSGIWNIDRAGTRTVAHEFGHLLGAGHGPNTGENLLTQTGRASTAVANPNDYGRALGGAINAHRAENRRPDFRGRQWETLGAGGPLWGAPTSYSSTRQLRAGRFWWN